MSDNEGLIEAPSTLAPEKKKYVMTEARRLAFEKCREKRKESVEKLQRGKQLLKLSEKVKKIQEKKDALKAVAEAEAEAEETVAPKVVKKPTPCETRSVRKKKRQVVVEESDSSSDSSVELIIKKKEKSHAKKRQSPLPCDAARHSTKQHMPPVQHDTNSRFIFV